MAECGCGRSPTGQCIGWHNLSEEEYQQKLKEHQEKAAEEQDEDNDDEFLLDFARRTRINLSLRDIR